METFFSLLKEILGLDTDTLTMYQIAARCVVIYIIGIALVRFGKKRFLGKIAAFDTILAIIIGSLLSKTVTDTDYFLEILGATFIFIMLHRLFSFIAAYSDRFGNWIKGHERVVLKDGELLREAMKKSSLSYQDVMQSLRQNAQTEDVSKVKTATLERSGDISVILKEEKE